MKLLIVTQYYYPENFIINDLVKSLKKRGYEIEVLTAIPNYPLGKFYQGYNFFNKNSELLDDIKIHRSRIIPRFNGGKIGLIFNYISFVIFGSLKLLSINGKFDRVFIFAPSPVTVGIIGIIAAKKFQVKSYLWVQDLWPESVAIGGNIRNKLILNLINLLTKLIYKYIDVILVQSEYFIEYIYAQGVPKNKICYLPNYASDIYTSRKIEYIKDSKEFNEFTITFAGNIGESQNLEILVKAANLLKIKDEKLKFIIIGSGRKRKALINKIKKENLLSYFVFIDRKSPEIMPSYFALSDVLFISLKKADIFSLTIPSKLQSYLAFGKPILGSIDGITNKIIKKSKCGYVSNADDLEGLVQNIITLRNIDKKQLEIMGTNALKFYKLNFSKRVVIDRLIESMS